MGEIEELTKRLAKLKAQRAAKQGNESSDGFDSDDLTIGDLDDSNIKTDIENTPVPKKYKYGTVGRNFCKLRKKDGTQAEFVDEGEEYNPGGRK